MARGSPMRVDPETGRMSSPGMCLQLSNYRLQPIDRPDVPGQGQYIAPMAVGMKKRPEQDVVASRKSLLERREPMVRSAHEACVHQVGHQHVARRTSRGSFMERHNKPGLRCRDPRA